MADPALTISLAAEFVGKNAFKQADKATDKLSKNVKKLAGALGVTFGVGAILAFGKASVKAAAADEKAQKQLALALKNVGLGRDVASSEAYLQKLSTEFGVIDDELRPAYQMLAVATGDTAKSQQLLQVALDISASTGKNLGDVTKALSKTFLGNNAALLRLGVGISKADLKTKSFEEIVSQLAKTFKGAAAQSADTFSGKMARLTVSIDNAKEVLGKGLIDSFMILTDSAGIEQLQVKIEEFATSASEGFKKLAGFLKENETLVKSILAILAATYVSSKILIGVAATVTAINTLNKAYKALRATALATAIAEMFALNPYGAALQVAGMVALIGITIKGVDALTDAWNNASDAKDYALNPKKYDNAATAFDKQFKGQEKLVTSAKKLTAEEIKTLNAKKLQLAIDKAKLALGKGEDVFNMEKIQLAAAERNAAEQLGKITSQAQLLQITNDLARLEVKQSINALEDAIAAKDIKAIEAGTAKLNADLMILGALTGQKVKLLDIKDILQSIVPKDLINLGNLDAAIARLLMIASFGDGSGMKSHAAPILSDPNASPKGFPTGSILAAGGFLDVVGGGGYSSSAGNYASSGFPGAQKNGDIYVTVNAGAIADPDGLVTLVKTAIQDLNRAGDSTTFAGAIA